MGQTNMANQCPPKWHLMHLPLILRNQISQKRFLVPPPPPEKKYQHFLKLFPKAKLLVFHGFFMDSDVLF